jgi:hypothetical protein
LVGPANADVAYDQGDLCGWDEMMPTIAACRYPGSGLALADHGELWQRPWTVVAHSSNSISTTVSGSLGYDFERVISLEAERVNVDYRVVAKADGLNFLWAAHPFLAVGPDTGVHVDGVSGFCEVHNDGGRTSFNWPHDGLTIGEALAPDTDKKFFARASSDHVAVVLRDAEGPSLTWCWSKEDAPWLGVWLDRASLSSHLVAAIEPTNASDDSLEVAASRGESWALVGGEQRCWSISITVGALGEEEGTQ